MRIALIKPTIGTKNHSLYVDEGRMEPLQLGVIGLRLSTISNVRKICDLFQYGTRHFF